MSLYNALFGKNKDSDLLLKIIGIDQSGGKYQSGRFRDIYLNADGSKIILYTRNGGGNRDEYQPLIDILATHPNYLKDYDDDFDCTYAYIEFSVPDEFKEEVKALTTGKEPEKIGDAFQRLVKDMESNKETEEVARSKRVGKKIFREIEDQKDGIIIIDSTDGDIPNKN